MTSPEEVGPSAERSRSLAGSSAAFFLKHFKDLKKLGLESDVTVFERNDYVGGRSTVVWPWHDNPYATPKNETDDPVELGASIFIEVCLYLSRKRSSRLSTQTASGE